MYSVETLAAFDVWLAEIKDRSTRIRLARRLDKARRGSLGDVASVGDGVYEMREFFGPGWRMYYMVQGEVLIVILGGGDKSSQSRDITMAKQRAKELS